jgi:hypothetical protein
MGLPSFNPETYELSLLYARAVDRGDPSIFDRIFTEDAQLIYGDDVYRGIAEVKRTTEVARQMFRQTLHYMVNHLAELDGDSGTTETYCMAQHISHDEMLPMHLTWYLRYLDEVVRVDGQWRIRRRELIVEFNTRTAGRLGVA